MSVMMSDPLGVRDAEPRRLSDVSSLSRRRSCVVENTMVPGDGNQGTTKTATENDPNQTERKLSRFVGNTPGADFEIESGQDDDELDDPDFPEYSADDCVDLNREMEVSFVCF